MSCSEVFVHCYCLSSFGLINMYLMRNTTHLRHVSEHSPVGIIKHGYYLIIVPQNSLSILRIIKFCLMKCYFNLRTENTHTPFYSFVGHCHKHINPNKVLFTYLHNWRQNSSPSLGKNWYSVWNCNAQEYIRNRRIRLRKFVILFF